MSFKFCPVNSQKFHILSKLGKLARNKLPSEGLISFALLIPM